MLRATSLIANSTTATLDVTALLGDVLAARIRACFSETFASEDPPTMDLACDVAQMALSRISTSDALYHNVEHTVHVTLVGLAILRGRQIRERDVAPDDWLHAVVAMLCHDIGFVRGLLRGDRSDAVRTGRGSETVPLEPGGTDAKLMPLHVDRGRTFARTHFAEVPLLDPAVIEANIERTRFPVPDAPDYQVCDDYPGLVRGADLIGQLSDQRYLNKLAAVFFELEENGPEYRQDYQEPGDLVRGYPDFFHDHVAPYLGPSLDYLSQTAAGREVVTQLYANLERARHQTV
mgnify:CR=1 FL=1